MYPYMHFMAGISSRASYVFSPSGASGGRVFLHPFDFISGSARMPEFINGRMWGIQDQEVAFSESSHPSLRNLRVWKEKPSAKNRVPSSMDCNVRL